MKPQLETRDGQEQFVVSSASARAVNASMTVQDQASRGQSDVPALLARVLADVHRDQSDLHLVPEQWGMLVEQACSEWLGGLVLEGVNRHHWPVPRSHLPLLYRQALRIQFLNRKLMRTLSNVVALLDRKGVPVVLLKGAGLLLTVYDRFDIRSMSDLDLLIRPQDVEKTLRTLTQHGCRLGAPLVRDDFFPKYHYETELSTDEPNPVRIDLHVRPFRPMRLARTLPLSAVWSDARPLRLSGHDFGTCSNPDHAPQAYVPCDEVMLIHLCTHAAFHGCSRLQWLYDIKRFSDLQGNRMDWDLFLERTRQWQLSAAVLQTLNETAKIFGEVVPDRVVNSLTAQPILWQDRLVLRQAPRDAWSPLAHVVVNLLCTPGIRFRVGYLLAQIFPGRAHMAGVYTFRHPGWLLVAHLWRGLRIPLRMLAALRPQKWTSGGTMPTERAQSA